MKAPFAPLPGRIGTLAARKNPPLSAIADFGIDISFVLVL